MPVYVDMSRCIGCRSCEVACKRVHGGQNHIYVQVIEDRASVPLLCHHCDNATCTMACFSGALVKEGERTAFDISKCTGCGLCRLACPFGVVWTDKFAHKCNLCAGQDRPTCVTTCPAQALSSDYDTASAKIRQKVATEIIRGGRR